MPILLDESTLALHAFSLAASGWTILPGQVDAQELAALRAASDRGLMALKRHHDLGLPVRHYSGSKHYLAMRAMYCWDEACRRIIEHPSIAALASRVLGAHRLWDLSTMCALPVAPGDESGATGWHRDFSGSDDGPGYLWFFLCLDDVTAENGATWAVPGSHHRGPAGAPQFPLPETWCSDAQVTRFPTGMPLAARAGDIMVLDPTVLHSSGRNATLTPRRLLNIGVCRHDRKPLFDHWALAGADVQRHASPRLREMLDSGPSDLDQTWSVLPEGWRTEPRGESDVRRPGFGVDCRDGQRAVDETTVSVGAV